MSDERRRVHDGMIHEVSAMIGKLDARVEQHTDKLETLCSKIERVHERHDTFLEEFRRHVDREDEYITLVTKVKDDIKAAKEAGDDWLKWKQRAMWIGAGVVSAGGAAGTSINEFIARLRGWL